MSFNDLVSWANQPWESPAERIASYGSARYKDPQDQGFRDAVAMKEALTEQVLAEAGLISEPTKPGLSTTIVEGGELKVQPRTRGGMIVMDTGGNGPTLEEELKAFESKPLPSFTQPTGSTKPE